MIKKVTITKVFKSDKKTDGTPRVYKSGKNANKPFTQIGIKTDKTGDNIYNTNAMAGDRAMNIEEGQSLLLNFTETPSEDGAKTWFNFNFPTKQQLAEFAEESAK